MNTRQPYLWLLLVLLCGSIIGCGENSTPPLISDESCVPSSDGLPPMPNQPVRGVTQSYPNFSFYLNVPWLPQVPPGSWSGTKNCGQACGVMLGGYFNHGAVASWVITAENMFLADRFDDPRYNNANGWYTNFDGRNTLGTLLTEFHGLHYTVYHGRAPDDVVNEMLHGRPVICGVMIKNGRLVGSGGTPHWVLAVGWDGRIYLHDPGTTRGRFIAYTKEDFDASWFTSKRTYVPVRR
ncbi:MAG: hypothetical protein WC497_02645 [Patescibacteria group bacterium]